MSARVFIHPACVSGPRSLDTAQLLADHGYDMNRMMVHPPMGTRKSHRWELVRYVGARGPHTVFRRLDGVPFRITASTPVAA